MSNKKNSNLSALQEASFSASAASAAQRDFAPVGVILIRMDSSSAIGLGHLMRTLLLAEGLRNDFSITYITQELKGNQNRLIEQNGFARRIVSSMDCSELIEIAKELKPSLFIIDHYGVDINCEAKLKELCRVLVFDDEFKEHRADIVLNHSFIADEKDYSYLKDTKILAGARYTLLKDDFLSHKNRFTPLDSLKNKKVLVTLGGSDPLGLSLRVKKYLLSLEKTLSVTIVTTSANQKITFLKIRDKELVIDEKEMAELMRAHDLIITSASTSLLETFALKKPFIAIKCASNQARTVDILKRQDLKNIIEVFTPAALKKALNFVQYHPYKIKRVLDRYSFKKNGVAKELIIEYK
ncbi:UDP-2,4-diacetamido-2,4,6-trideoxy-beta-L-altropyranose hydrolase [Sulfurimonas sp. HSL-1716]|uniref:UDP-2,4-diacetamido-2,4, 6-trideoxy-beta-L-altropyranose hydrolase n=1 Tax=Hydrocurvibacter sulfurireducens TaxID=3131937 RepID=UPI0031F79978